jgi:hypothetical protein
VEARGLVFERHAVMTVTNPKSDKPSCGAGCGTIVFIAFIVWMTLAKLCPSVLVNLAEKAGQLFRDDQEIQRKHDQEMRRPAIVPIVMPKKEDR